MGYTTRYKLIAVVDSEEASDWKIRPTFLEALGHRSQCFSGEPLKWHTFDTDIARAVTESRAVRVVIHGVGEDDGDEWRCAWTCDEYGIARSEPVEDIEYRPEPGRTERT